MNDYEFILFLFQPNENVVAFVNRQEENETGDDDWSSNKESERDSKYYSESEYDSDIESFKRKKWDPATLEEQEALALQLLNG